MDWLQNKLDEYQKLETKIAIEYVVVEFAEELLKELDRKCKYKYYVEMTTRIIKEMGVKNGVWQIKGIHTF